MLLQPKTRRNPAAQCLLLVVFLWDVVILGIAAALSVESTWLSLPAPIAGMFGFGGMDGLIGWTQLASLCLVGAASIVMGHKTRGIGWWLFGFCFLLTSVDQLALLDERLRASWGLTSLGAHPWSWLALPILVSLVGVALRRVWRDTERTPALRRSNCWAASMWALALLLGLVEGPLLRAELSLWGLELAQVARFGTECLQLLAPLLALYAVVSLIEYFERQARLEERRAIKCEPRIDRARQAA